MQVISTHTFSLGVKSQRLKNWTFGQALWRALWAIALLGNSFKRNLTDSYLQLLEDLVNPLITKVLEEDVSIQENTLIF